MFIKIHRQLLFKKIQIITILFICFIKTVSAQNDSINTELSVEELYKMPLEELLTLKVTTGSFLNLDIKNSSTSMTIITAEQIESSGARHLTEVLEIYVPGFQYMVNKWNGLIWGMRGVSSDRNTKFIFLVNGHKMNTESRDGAITELDLGMLDDIKRIEVLRGPSGLVYGSGAIAGVINVVTKEYEKDIVNGSINMNTWNGNSFGQEYQATFARKINDKATLKVDIGSRKSDGIGSEATRIWGRPSWPFNQAIANSPQKGIPSNGSAWSTPGNSKLSADFKNGNFRLYTRLTHQVTNSAGWFVLDPWPDVAGNPTATDSKRLVDGNLVDWTSPYAYSETWGYNRRQYVLNNISTSVEYLIPLGSNQIKLKAGFDILTNRIQFEDLKGYESQYPIERNTQIAETFGERRYNVGGMYMYKPTSKFELATGFESSIYDIGEDMSGKNSQNEKTKHLIVSDVLYFYNSVYSEGVYRFTEKIDFHGGIRYDIHTRTIQYGGIVNPKLGIIYKVNKNNSLKLVFQQSANNGSADNYEFNRNSIGDDGKTFEGDSYHFSELTNENQVIPPVNGTLLHQLKPERSQSFECMSFHQISKSLIVMPSVSYNTISNLFSWNQSLFRVINAGKYNFVNIDFDIQYSKSNIVFGMNHTFQRLLGMDVKKQETVTMTPVFRGRDSTLDGNTWNYSPHVVTTADGSDSTIAVTNNSIRDGVTVDGKNFVNLATNVTKIFVDYKPTNWLTLHSSVRMFWGLIGRKDVHTFDSLTSTNQVLTDLSSGLQNANKYPYLSIDNVPMFKINIGAVINTYDNRLKISFHVYDLLGGNGTTGSVHSLRWQEFFSATTATDLYGIDYRSFAVKIGYTF